MKCQVRLRGHTIVAPARHAILLAHPVGRLMSARPGTHTYGFTGYLGLPQNRHPAFRAKSYGAIVRPRKNSLPSPCIRAVLGHFYITPSLATEGPGAGANFCQTQFATLGVPAPNIFSPLTFSTCLRPHHYSTLASTTRSSEIALRNAIGRPHVKFGYPFIRRTEFAGLSRGCNRRCCIVWAKA